MTAVAVWVLTVAVVAGAILAAWHLKAADGTSRRPPLAAGIAHGVVGIAGLVVLLFALQGPARGVAAGVGSFGIASAGLFMGAVLTGIAFLLLKRSGFAIAVHAAIAITGYVLLLAWNSLG